MFGLVKHHFGWSLLTMTCFPGMYCVLRYHLRSTGGLTVLARIEIVTILVHYQTTLLHFTHAMKPSDPLHCCSLKGFFCVACVYNFITEIILNIRQHQWRCLTRLPPLHYLELRDLLGVMTRSAAEPFRCLFLPLDAGAQG